mgnify:CR=1 FL=1
MQNFDPSEMSFDETLKMLLHYDLESTNPLEEITFSSSVGNINNQNTSLMHYLTMTNIRAVMTYIRFCQQLV